MLCTNYSLNEIKKTKNIAKMNNYFLKSFVMFCNEEGDEFKDLFDDVAKQERELAVDAQNSINQEFIKLNKRLFLPYGISQVKINGNKSYYTFTEHYGHPPFKNLMQDFLSSLGTNDDELLKEKLMNYLTAPSLKILIEERNILTMINMGIYKSINSNLNKFPVPPILIWAFPDVINWLHGNGSFLKMKTLLDYDLNIHIDDKGFIAVDSFAYLIDCYLQQTSKKLECIKEW